MRAPLIVSLVAVAMVASGCSATPEPLPSTTANGLITEITSPEGVFDVAWTAAVGDDGAAVVYFTPRQLIPQLGRPLVGIALVSREGEYEIIVDPGDERFEGEWPVWAEISDSTVVWGTEGDGPAAATHFLDRASGSITAAPTSFTEGEFAGEPIKSSTTGYTLVDDVLFSIQWTPRADTLQQVLVARTGDGRAWIPFSDDRSWFRMGQDECASTPGHDMLWGLEQVFMDDSSSFRFWHIDATDPGDPLVLDDSSWTTDRTVERVQYIVGARCGDDVVAWGQGVTPSGEGSDRFYAIVNGDDPAGVTVLDAQVGRLAIDPSLTPEWVALPSVMFEGGGRYLIHRASGSTGELASEGVCTSLEVHGDFVSWQVPTGDSRLPSYAPLAAGCDTYVGLLTPPTD